MKKLKILSIMLLAAIWTILFAYVLFQWSAVIFSTVLWRLSCEPVMFF